MPDDTRDKQQLLNKFRPSVCAKSRHGISVHEESRPAASSWENPWMKSGGQHREGSDLRSSNSTEQLRKHPRRHATWTFWVIKMRADQRMSITMILLL